MTSSKRGQVACETSTHSSVSSDTQMCACGSMRPGITTPSGDRIFVAGPVSPSSSAADPSATMRPSRTAIASALGAAGSPVAIRPTTRRSAVAVGALRSPDSAGAP